MLTHIVMWRLKEFADGKPKSENAQWLKQNLESLVDQIPELLSAEVGININASGSAFDAVLTATFADLQTLESYKINPLHRRISERCKLLRSERVVCDYYNE